MNEVVKVKAWDSAVVGYCPSEVQQRLSQHSVVLKDLAEQSRECYLVRTEADPLFFVASFPMSMLGNDRYVWLVPFMGLKARHLRTLRGLFNTWAAPYHKLTARVFTDEPHSARFAEFFGFEFSWSMDGLITYERVN